MGRTHSYWAFISYCHEDSEAAQTLQRELESYRIPNALAGRMGRDGAVPKRLYPVFLDREELAGSNSLTDEICDSLRQSRYLIVVCSLAAVRSKWVTEEIRFFKSLGREDRVLTCIVDGEPGASENPAFDDDLECFPEAVRYQVDDDGALTKEPSDPLAADARPGEDGAKLALLKLVAAVAGAPLADLTGRDEQRRRRRRLAGGLAAGALLAFLGAAAFLWWNHVRIRVEHYAALTTRWGVPEGVYRLDPDELRRRVRSWKIESSRGKVRRVQLVHSSGSVVDLRVRSKQEHWAEYDSTYDPFEQLLAAHVPADLEAVNAGTIEVKYAESGIPRRWDLRDRNGRIKGRIAFSDNLESIASMHPDLNHPFPLTIQRPGEQGDKRTTRITKFRVTYGTNGLVEKLDFYDDYENPQPTDDGLAGIRFFYGERLALPEKEVYLNLAGEVATAGNGVSMIRHEFTGRGQLAEKILLDAKGKPAPRSDGIARIERTYDKAGNLLNAQFFMADGSAGFHGNGFARMTIERSRDGSPASITYTDLEGGKTPHVLGYSDRVFTSDSDGNVISEQYLDTTGEPTLHRHGFSKRVNAYDGKGNLTGVTFHDEQDLRSPVSSGEESGFTGYRLTLGVEGRELEFTYLDPHDEPVLINRGFASSRLRYNFRGKLERLSLHGPRGEPVLHTDGYSSIDYDYDQKGFLVNRSYLGTDGNPVNAREPHGDHTHDYARMSYGRDLRGNLTETRWFAADGSPVFIHGAHILRRKYNDRGLLESFKAFDAAEQPTVAESSFETRRGYDASGNEIESAAYGISGQPDMARMIANTSFSVHLIRSRRDAQGRETEVAYFDADGKRMLRPEYYSVKRMTYDPRGNLTSRRFFDTELNPCKSVEGYHKEVIKHDARGNPVDKFVFAADGAPVEDRYGSHRVIWDYNRLNQYTRAIYFSADGKPRSSFYHIVEMDYDRLGHVKEQRLLGPDGELVDSGIPVWRYERRPDGKVSRFRYFGAGGQPVLSDEKIHGVDYSYDRFGNETGRLFVGVDNNPTALDGDPYASWRDRVDPFGRVLERAYFGRDGNPVADMEGVFVYRYARNPLGKMAEQTHHGPNGEPILSRGQWYRKKLTYNPRGNLEEVTYFDVSGDPVDIVRFESFEAGEKEEASRNPHRRVNLYDQQDRLVGWKVFGPDGDPALSNGVHYFEIGYDQRGNRVLRRYHGVNGQLVVNEWGYASWEKEYDQFGREIEKRLYDPEGKLKTSILGYARYTYRYNALGKRIEETYYDADGNLAIYVDGGYARVERRFDDGGELVEEKKYNAEGKLIAADSAGE